MYKKSFTSLEILLQKHSIMRKKRDEKCLLTSFLFFSLTIKIKKIISDIYNYSIICCIPESVILVLMILVQCTFLTIKMCTTQTIYSFYLLVRITKKISTKNICHTFYDIS